MSVSATPQPALADAPPAPEVTLSMREKLQALRIIHTGQETIRENAGRVAVVRVGPSWMVPPFAFVSSPQGAHDVLAASSSGAIDKTTLIHGELRRLIGDSSFDLPTEEWRPRRRTNQPLFTKKNVATYAGHMAAAAERLAARSRDAGTLDVDDEMRGLTLDVLGQALFGIDLSSRRDILGPAIVTTLQYVMDRAQRPVRAPVWLPTPSRADFREALASLRTVCEEAIDAAIHAGEGVPVRGLAAMLVGAADPDMGKRLTEAEVVDELIVFLIAGHDTTATTMSYALWSLGRDPALQDRLAAEAAAPGDRTLVHEDVPQLPFTIQVIHEALRLCPPGSALPRVAERDLVVDGHRIEAGTNIIVGVYALHRDPDHWEDAERFDPDRFSAERSVGRERWQYLPFGAGPRSCVGDHFAMLEMTLGLATLVRDLRIESVEQTFPMAVPFTLTAGGPIPVRVSARD